MKKLYKKPRENFELTSFKMFSIILIIGFAFSVHIAKENKRFAISLENQITEFCTLNHNGEPLPPETLTDPILNQFNSYQNYSNAKARFKLCGHWAT